MAENKKSIVVYADWIEKFEQLEDDEAGRLIKHFFRYVNDFNPEPPDRTTKLMFIDIEATLKRDLIKWEKRAERSRENGSKGGRPSLSENLEKPKETQQVFYEPKKPDSVSVNASVNDTVNEIKLIMDFFGFNEITNPDKLRDCSTFINILNHQNLFTQFQKQFTAYRKLKPKGSKYIHQFKKFLGTPSELYMDGAWNSENWQSKIEPEKEEKIINGIKVHPETSKFVM